MELLTDDAIYALFSYLDDRTLCVLACVCRRLHDLASSDALWAQKSRACIATNQIATSIQRRSCCILSAKDKCRISLNWKKGKCKRVCLIKQRTKYMPWLQLNTNELWISQGERISGYHHIRSGLITRKPQRVLRGDNRTDICRFVVTDDCVISGGSDGSILGWNVNNGQSRFKAYGSHQGEINTIDCHAHIVVSGSRDRSAKIWALDESISQRLKINFQDRVWSVALSPTYETFLCGTGGCYDHPLMLYDTTSGTLTATLGTNYAVGAGVLHSIYETPFNVLTCGYDTYIRHWDLRSQECIQKWENPYDLAVYCLSSDHNMTFVSGSSSHGLVWLWDKRSFKPVQMHYVGTGNSPVYSVSFDPCHLYVSLDRSLHLLDFATYETQRL